MTGLKFPEKRLDTGCITGARPKLSKGHLKECIYSYFLNLIFSVVIPKISSIFFNKAKLSIEKTDNLERIILYIFPSVITIIQKEIE